MPPNPALISLLFEDLAREDITLWVFIPESLWNEEMELFLASVMMNTMMDRTIVHEHAPWH